LSAKVNKSSIAFYTRKVTGEHEEDESFVFAISYADISHDVGHDVDRYWEVYAQYHGLSHASIDVDRDMTQQAPTRTMTLPY
jgi:hypothetical protein